VRAKLLSDRLAEALGWEFVDLDNRIVAKIAGASARFSSGTVNPLSGRWSTRSFAVADGVG